MKARSPLHPALLLALLALLGGCASTTDYRCDAHESRTRGIKPTTTYRLIEPKPGHATPRPLPPGSIAQVSTYKMTFRPGFTKPCTTLTLRKDVVIHRSADPDMVLTEVREFYAEDGTLITPSTQDITEQVKKSGTYVATTPVPIPRSAPPGKYKIVCKLLFERHGSSRSAVQIARAEGYFYIIPPQ